MRGLLLLLALALFWPSPAKTECLASAEAVWQAHPGAHATYHGSRNNRCWMARDNRGKRHEAKSIPLPRERPAKFIRVRSASTDAPESQGKQGISDVSRDEARQHLAGTPEQLYAAGKRLLAEAMRAKMAEAGR